MSRFFLPIVLVAILAAWWYAPIMKSCDPSGCRKITPSEYVDKYGWKALYEGYSSGCVGKICVDLR